MFSVNVAKLKEEDICIILNKKDIANVDGCLYSMKLYKVQIEYM
jgi:hypothetical protein